MTDAYTLTLAREYVQIVSTIQNGQYNSPEEWQALDRERQTTHNELCRVLNVSRREDMYRLCRNLLHTACAQGDYDE